MAADLSPETKLIVASNMAVAHAILELIGVQRGGGSSVVSIEKQVVGLVATALKQVDALAEKI